MTIIALLLLALICINVAFHSIQSKKLDKYLEKLEKELANEFKATKKQ